jgi:hypothetical protein
MWLLGFFAFHVAGGLIHLLLIIAVISLAVHFFREWRVRESAASELRLHVRPFGIGEDNVGCVCYMVSNSPIREEWRR